MSSPDDSRPGESALIARYFAPLATHPGAAGLTDDAASLIVPPGDEAVITKDMLVAGEHFFPDDPPDLIARKALRVNLSDLAAKGAVPLGCLLGLALPDDWTGAWLEAFARGLGEDVAAYACPLLGGDTVRARGALTVSITAIGRVPAGRIVRRGGAEAGDLLYVSGTIGDGALGLAVRLGNLPLLSPDLRAALEDRYLLPRPRLGLSEALLAYANAAMDVSDGLAGDLAKLCEASHATAIVHVRDVPLSAAADGALGLAPGMIAAVLGGGDDYEILAAIPPAQAAAFERAAKVAGIPVAPIGQIKAGQGAPRFLLPNGDTLRLDRPSFSHF